MKSVWLFVGQPALFQNSMAGVSIQWSSNFGIHSVKRLLTRGHSWEKCLEPLNLSECLDLKDLEKRSGWLKKEIFSPTICLIEIGPPVDLVHFPLFSA